MMRASVAILLSAVAGCGTDATLPPQDGASAADLARPGSDGSSGGDLATGGGDLAITGDFGAPPTHFSTLPPGAQLPSEAQCAAWVSAQPTPETMPTNAAENATTPTPAWLTDYYAHPDQDLASNGGAPYDLRVTGNFTGSTDMILRWAACKWGIDEDLVRAEAWEESSWRMSLHSDSATGADCHSANVPMTALNYWSDPSPCQPSRGILQCRLTYFNLYPYADTSTALNADYRMARQRICMEGGIPWFVGSNTTDWGSYPPASTDNALYGCMNAWFSGQWVNDANSYVMNLKMILANRPWPK
jgi:autotransporter family porin